jgi:thioredoxin-dependent peroxiredoxin
VLKPGTAAPLFEAKLHTGELFRLAALRNHHHLVLYFYPKDFTFSCTREACSFRDSFDEMKDLGAIILGASPDAPERHDQFARKHRLAFSLVSDPQHELARRYEASLLDGLRMLRMTYVIDMKGIIRGAFHHELLVSTHLKNSLRILKSLQR